MFPSIQSWGRVLTANREGGDFQKDVDVFILIVEAVTKLPLNVKIHNLDTSLC